MRKSFTTIVLAVILTFFNGQNPCAAAQGTAMSAAELLRGASVTEISGVRVVRLKGSPYRMGYQHGALLKKQIHYLYRTYLLGWLREQSGTGLKFRAALRIFRKSAARMERYIPEEYRQEMRGIADGSGLSYRNVLVMHTFIDVLANPRIVKKPVLSCTNFMTVNAASAGRRLIHGRNLSWPSRGLLDKYTTVVLYEPESGNRLTAMSWPGVCGALTGMNEKGVTLAETAVASTESTVDGVPAFILFRQALQYGDTMYDVIRRVGSARRTSGYTLGIADGKLKRACVLECTGWRYSVRFPENDSIVGANHYIDHGLLKTMKPVYKGVTLTDMETYKRSAHIAELIRKNFGRIDRAAAERFLGDPVMNTPGTFISVVFEPEQLTFSLAVGHERIARGEFTRFDLKREFSLKAPAAPHADPEKFYDYVKTPWPEERSLVGQDKNYRKYQVSFPDKSMFLNYYEPKGKKDFPVIIILPHFTGSAAFIEGRFAEKFASQGMGAVVIDMDFQVRGKSWLSRQLKQGDLDTLTGLFRGIIVDARRTIDWLETQPGVDTSRIGVMGVSLGAIAAPIVCGNDPRIKAAAYVLGGGDLATILYNAREAEFFRKRLVAQNISPLEFRSRFSVIDPLTYAFRAKKVPSVMFNAMFDKLIPKQSTMELWKALEYPRMVMYPGGHYTAFMFLPDFSQRVYQHFKDCLG